MNRLRPIAVAAAAAATLLFAAGCTTVASTTNPPPGSEIGARTPLSAEARRELDAGYRDTLQRLYDTTPGSREMVAKAAGVLIFPRAVSAGFMVGGEYGNGELRARDRFGGYYRTTSVSFGPQIGAQSRALVFLFMTQDALQKFEASKGWSVGADASVAVAKAGANGAIEVSSSGASTVGFVMTNAGLMANLALEGTKITRIE